MAYSDYGGYAFKNGERIEERSDVFISDEGLKSTPGQWPGWMHRDARNGSNYHVVLGSEVLLCLYKCTNTSVIDRNSSDLGQILIEKYPEAYWESKESKKKYFDVEEVLGEVLEVTIDGVKIELLYEDTFNYVQYARVTEKNGDVWTGFSSYGVGAGLEESEDHYMESSKSITKQCITRLNELFPYIKTS